MNLVQKVTEGSKNHNVGQTERWISLAGGALALGLAFTKAKRTKWPLVAVGSSLLKRGATGSCELYRALGVNTCKNESHSHGASAFTEKREVPELSTVRS
jgi:uncharacterized membrane protein